MSWICEAFERWLDEGRPPEGEQEARAHAATCDRCAAALAVARELDRALALPGPERAPEGFADAVMRRVRTARAAQAAVRTLSLPPAAAWWVRAAGDPVVAAACALTALILWRREGLWALAAALSSRLTEWGQVSLRLPGAATLSFQTPAALRAFATPTVLLGLGLAVLPAVLWASWGLFRWSEHAFQPPAPRPVRAR